MSTNGLECVFCPAGMMPMVGLRACESCPLSMYYDQINGECKPCGRGMELNVGGDASTPCVPCDAVSAGDSGVCEVCESGKMPNLGRTFCEACPVGYAGTAGVCTICPPGTHQKEDQTACPATLARNNWTL